MDFELYQQRAQSTNLHRGGDPVAFYVLGITGEVGSLAAAYKKRLRDGQAHGEFVRRVSIELGDVLWYVSALASELGLNLGDIAVENLEKTAARWLPVSSTPVRLDLAAPPGQQLPARIKAVFRSDGHSVEVSDGEGNRLGDRLTDNAHESDNYRYHDVFHLAHAAVLGWSPLVRSQLQLKRKYDEKVDEVEDGARAIFTEEGLTAVIFKYAEAHDFLRGMSHVDSEVLDFVRSTVAGLEVSVRSTSDWEAAVLQGYEAWRQLVEHGGGTVVCDLDAGSINYVAIPGAS